MKTRIGKFQFAAEHSASKLCYSLYGWMDLPAGEGWKLLEPLTARELTDDDEGLAMTPFAELRRSEAQSLIDALWSSGLRPSSGEGNAGQLGATEAHLKDMQTLVKQFMLREQKFGHIDKLSED